VERLAKVPHDPERMARTRTIQDPGREEHEAEPIGFRSSGEHFNEYDVWKVKETYDSLQNPVYLVEHLEVTAVDAPDDLSEGG
jgi:hypothetical protein